MVLVIYKQNGVNELKETKALVLDLNVILIVFQLFVIAFKLFGLIDIGWNLAFIPLWLLIALYIVSYIVYIIIRGKDKSA